MICNCPLFMLHNIKEKRQNYFDCKSSKSIQEPMKCAADETLMIRAKLSERPALRSCGNSMLEFKKKIMMPFCSTPFVGTS